MNESRPLFALVCPLVVAAWLGSVPAAAKVDLAPCNLDGISAPIQCGTLAVPEHRGHEADRRIRLRIVVLQATGEHPEPDPLFVLQGGPGQAASDLAPFYANAFAGIRVRRDIVLVDQRGTGGSNRLDCRLFGDDPTPARYLGRELSLDVIRDCRDALAQRADLTQYTTPIAMDDLDAVRDALGYEQINLYGTSYGSLAAQVYLRRHGRRVRSAILRAALPLGGHWLQTYAANVETALDRLFALCAENATCHDAYGDLDQALTEVHERLRATPATFTLPNPDTDGGAMSLPLDARAFSSAVRGHLSAPSFAARLPLAIARAHRGDFAPIGQAALRLRRGAANALAWGMFFTIACNEMVAQVTEPRTPWRRIDDGRSADLVDVCALWPSAPLPADFSAPVRSAQPVLIVSGWLDPSTPPEGAEKLTRTLTNSKHLVIRHGGHSFDNLGGCLEGILEQFVETASPHAIDTACVDRIAMPPFAIDTP